MPDGIQALSEAARRGDCAVIAEMLDHEPALVAAKHEGATALHFAALEGRLDAMELLLARGAALDARDDEFNSPPAGWANEKGHAAAVEYLVRCGASMSACQAAAYGFLDRLEAILAADPEALHRLGGFGTPLHEAVIWGRTAIVERLLELGADPEASSADGATAADLAAAQAKNARARTPIVTEERRAEIERECERISAMLQRSRRTR